MTNETDWSTYRVYISYACTKAGAFMLDIYNRISKITQNINHPFINKFNCVLSTAQYTYKRRYLILI